MDFHSGGAKKGFRVVKEDLKKILIEKCVLIRQFVFVHCFYAFQQPKGSQRHGQSAKKADLHAIKYQLSP